MTSLTWLLLSLFSPTAFSSAAQVDPGYDTTWFYSDTWFGDWPGGFSVVQDGVIIPLHSQIVKDAKPDLQCALPKKAVFHIWNADRDQEWVTYSKIVPLKVAQGFTAKVYDQRGRGADVTFKKGEVIEHITYKAENFVLVRYKGGVFEMNQHFMENMINGDKALDPSREQWFQVNCDNGVSGWINYADVIDLNGVYLNGLDSWILGLVGTGEVHDLP